MLSSMFCISLGFHATSPKETAVSEYRLLSFLAPSRSNCVYLYRVELWRPDCICKGSV
jgi:hypothetical protein